MIDEWDPRSFDSNWLFGNATSVCAYTTHTLALIQEIDSGGAVVATLDATNLLTTSKTVAGATSCPTEVTSYKAVFADTNNTNTQFTHTLSYIPTTTTTNFANTSTATPGSVKWALSVTNWYSNFLLMFLLLFRLIILTVAYLHQCRPFVNPSHTLKVIYRFYFNAISSAWNTSSLQVSNCNVPFPRV
jgi:hypothetical protein